MLATHVVTMTLKVILCQGLGERISNLVLGVHREDLDESFVHMFAKMMVAYVALSPFVNLEMQHDRKEC